jgi:hypothetical protein
MGSAAFLAPLTRTRPFRGIPPFMHNLSKPTSPSKNTVYYPIISICAKIKTRKKKGQATVFALRKQLPVPLINIIPPTIFQKRLQGQE